MQSFRGSYANRGSGAQRASSDARARRVLFFSGKYRKEKNGGRISQLSVCKQLHFLSFVYSLRGTEISVPLLFCTVFY